MIEMAVDALTAHGAGALVVVLLSYLIGGYVKGAIGFALPLIAVSGAATVLPAETAVSTVILSTLATNLQQAFRQGRAALIETCRRFWPTFALTAVFIWVGALLLPGLDERLFFLGLGGFVLLFATIQLAGWNPRIDARAERSAGVGVGVVAGLSGGLSGIWGPPIILYLTALRLSKLEQVRAAGAAFLIGAVMLTPAHAATGVLNAETVWLSALAIVPAYIGMAIGQRTQDRLDIELFRKLTLAVLCLTALNLLRRGVFPL